MTNDQPAVTEDQTEWRCHFCQTTEEMISPEICRKCVQRILHKHYRRLRRHLELSYGQMIDNWLSTYRLEQSKWAVTQFFEIRKELVKRLLREIVQEAVEGYGIGLELLAGDVWSPIRSDELVNYLSEKCMAEISQYLKQVLIETIPNAPTEQAERELIEVIIGKKRVKPYRRDEAVMLLIDSRAMPFNSSGDSYRLSLIDMRYGSEELLSHYFDAEEGTVNEIWRLIEDSLPDEIVKLIATEESSQ